VVAIGDAARRFTWESTGKSMLDVYRAAAAAPARESAQLAEELVTTGVELEEAERKYTELWKSLTPDARTLVAPGGALGAEAQRSLAAVVRRPLTRRLLLGPLQLGRRLGRLGRRDRPIEPVETTPETFALHFGWANAEHMREQLAAETSDPPLTEP
jgi:hypothetical protein